MQAILWPNQSLSTPLQAAFVGYDMQQQVPDAGLDHCLHSTAPKYKWRMTCSITWVPTAPTSIPASFHNIVMAVSNC